MSKTIVRPKLDPRLPGADVPEDQVKGNDGPTVPTAAPAPEATQPSAALRAIAIDRQREMVKGVLRAWEAVLLQAVADGRPISWAELPLPEEHIVSNLDPVTKVETPRKVYLDRGGIQLILQIK